MSLESSTCVFSALHPKPSILLLIWGLQLEQSLRYQWTHSISYTKSCLSQIMSYYSLPVLRWQWNKAYTAILAVDLNLTHLGRGARDLSSRRRHTKCHYSACFVTSFLSFATSSRYEDWDETPLTHLVLLHLRLQITQIPEQMPPTVQSAAEYLQAGRHSWLLRQLLQ